MGLEQYSEHDFATKFFAAVDEFYKEWKEENPNSTLPDFERALRRAKEQGVEAIE